MKSKTQNLKSKIAALARFACRVPLLRLHPKLRWLNYACPLIERIEPPANPPKLKLRKRRRVFAKPSTKSSQP